MDFFIRFRFFIIVFKRNFVLADRMIDNPHFLNPLNQTPVLFSSSGVEKVASRLIIGTSFA